MESSINFALLFCGIGMVNLDLVKETGDRWGQQQQWVRLSDRP
ncbi:hypothetical protein [Almyronema epifaneia]|uniref:Uncharacterized protein n=1 Tax=Almyronema epifaneia S1 TaxID=2991925 RepID=A0ABW6IC89_9CYAN